MQDKCTQKALLNEPLTGYDNKDIMQAEQVRAWVYVLEAICMAI
jgi:hypothetical protein